MSNPLSKDFPTESERRQCLEDAIHQVVHSEHAFLGGVMQCMTAIYTQAVPTAGVCYDKKLKAFRMYINPTFFCRTLDKKERSAVLLHEFFHILHKHVFYSLEHESNKERMRWNVAMDLVINQLIKNLPDTAMFIKNFKDKNGKEFKANLTTQTYYQLLKDGSVDLPKSGDKGEPQEGEDQGESQPGGQGGWTSVEKWLDGRTGPIFDSHEWDEKDGDPASEKEKLEAISDLFKRAMIKSNFDYSQIKGSIKDFLDEVKNKLAKLDYKQILLSTLKKSVPSKDSEKTWKRPSRRYGELAKGNILGKLPKIEALIDTSGSISTEEANEFLAITNNFLTIGVQSAMLNLFHTANYHRKKIKKNHKLGEGDIQAGGTDLTESLQLMIKSRPDLVIVLTDGHWAMPDIDPKKLPEIVFIISKSGTTDHPLKKYGKTIQYA